MNGILLLGRDEVIESRAQRYKVALEHGDGLALPFEKTLITTPGTKIPWEWLAWGWGFLEKWDTAVPLWRYDVTAESVGSSTERALTQTVIRELRVLLHAVELLFVRRNEAGQALIECWKEEMALGPERRLAFLRAVYQVKPRLCVLPVSWVGQTALPETVMSKRGRQSKRPLVMVEIAPGQMVKCLDGDEQKVKRLVQMQRSGRGRDNRRYDEMAILSKKSFTTDNQKARMSKGPLIRVEIRPGQFVKMYEADAIAAGHIEPKVKPAPAQKARPAQENKSLPPQADKGIVKSDEPAAVVAPPAAIVEADDDFTTIPGIGKATARLLGAHGIATFDQLKTAKLDFLSSAQQQAIEEWRNG